MEKVAIYSSFKEKNSDSIKTNLKRITDWCVLKNYDYTIYLDKVKNRISLLNRNELEELKQDIKDYRYTKVIIKDLTHLSRNTKHNIEFIKFLNDNNCEIEWIDGTDLKLYQTLIEIYENKKEEEKVKWMII